MTALRVEVTRSGGFAGTVRRSVLDAASLGPEERAAVERLVGAVDLGALPAAGEPSGADRFQYDVVVHRGSAAERATVGEQELTPALRALIDRVSQAPPAS